MDLVGRLANPKRIRQLEGLVAQEGEGRPQTRFEGLEYSWWVDRDRCDSQIRDLGCFRELDQFSQLKLALGSPRASEERKDQGLAVCERGNGLLLAPIVDQLQIGESVSNVKLEWHGILLAGATVR